MAQTIETKEIPELVEALSGASRRARQNAASQLAAIAAEDPGSLAAYAGDFVDALNRPEAQTRWECLAILTALVDFDSRTCDKAIEGAEIALFDEDNGTVRLEALRFLCKLGATTEKRSQKVWPLIDEAIQCYHGDAEFMDMLTAIQAFTQGKLSEQVVAELKDRLAFDAENGKGPVGRKVQQIYSSLS